MLSLAGDLLIAALVVFGAFCLADALVPAGRPALRVRFKTFLWAATGVAIHAFIVLAGLVIEGGERLQSLFRYPRP